jgi:hypothetical protein
MIYFIQQASGGPIKIGYSENNIDSRIKSLQAGCPEKLILLGYIDGGLDQEKSLHNCLKDYRTVGEWFHPHPMVLSCIFSLIVGADISIIEEKVHAFSRLFCNNTNKNQDKKSESVCPNQFKKIITRYKNGKIRDFDSGGLELNTDKIKSEMARLGVKKNWLAKKLENTPAMVTYIFKYKPITFADRLAEIFNFDPKDLIK